MSEYRTYQRSTSDPAMADVYARIADFHDAAERRGRRIAVRSASAQPFSARASLASMLHRWAERIEPCPVRPRPVTVLAVGTGGR